MGYTKIDLSTYNLTKPGTYNIQVVAKGRGFLDSPMGNTASYDNTKTLSGAWVLHENITNPDALSESFTFYCDGETYTRMSGNSWGEIFYGGVLIRSSNSDGTNTWKHEKYRHIEVAGNAVGQPVSRAFYEAFTANASVDDSVIVGTTNLTYELSTEKDYYTCLGLAAGATDTEIVIPPHYNGIPIRNILHHAFASNTNITKVTISPGIRIIGESAFAGCSNLTEITIPDTVTEIEDGVFWKAGLRTVTVPDSVQRIGNGAFGYCTNLESITLPFIGESKNSETNTHFGYIFGAENYQQHNTYVTRNYLPSLTYIRITGKVFIKPWAFYNIAIPAQLIANNAYNVEESAFDTCGFTDIQIRNASPIHPAAFRYSSVYSVHLGAVLNTVWNSAFQYCNSLKHVYYEGTEEQWKNVKIENNNDALKNATIHYNS